ncbi:hypothetical protein SAMN05216428_102117 [Nitrosospira sp. Nsp11]|nr:hypothetical protein SAMN05216315_106110 [Nitrosospira sp. Nsp18]SHL35182.1 hypothetical protein SAMN05216428_102117 [Nitrosospira sp. Nsp11]
MGWFLKIQIAGVDTFLPLSRHSNRPQLSFFSILKRMQRIINIFRLW